MFCQSVALTHVGKVRDHNEDFYLCRPDLGLYIVCDGMGGHSSGEVASKLCATHICTVIEKNFKMLNSFQPGEDNPVKIKQLIQSAVDGACRLVYDLGQKDQSKKGMGTTLVMALFIKTEIYLAHVGDSRAYLKRGSKLHQVTKDHSLVNELLQQGIITPEQAKNHPRGNVITRAIGPTEVIQADILQMEVMEGDRFLLCSDGLSGLVTPQDISLGMAIDELKSSPQKLIEMALNNGGKDNVTCLMLETFSQNPNQEIEHSQSVMKKVETLHKIPLFTELDFIQIMRVIEIVQVKSFQDKNIVVKEGDKGDEMYIILAGKAEVTRNNILLGQLTAGSYFGEIALIDGQPRSATVKAVGANKFLVISRHKLFELFKREPEIANKVYWFFLNTLVLRLRKLEAHMTNQSANNKTESLKKAA